MAANISHYSAFVFIFPSMLTNAKISMKISTKSISLIKNFMDQTWSTLKSTFEVTFHESHPNYSKTEVLTTLKIRKKVTNLEQLLLVFLMHGKQLEITAFYMIFLEGFLSSRSSHVLTSCQMHSDRTLVHPYGMCALTAQQRYENAPFDNKHFSIHC